MSSERDAPGIAFNRAMTDVGVQCRRLEAAIECRDISEALHAAQNAAELWRLGHSACRRLVAESSSQMSPYADAARRLLEEGYMMILGLLAIFVSKTPPPEVQAEANRLREALTRSMARPLVDGDTERLELAGTLSRLR